MHSKFQKRLANIFFVSILLLPVSSYAAYRYDSFACQFFNVILIPLGGCRASVAEKTTLPADEIYTVVAPVPAAPRYNTAEPPAITAVLQVAPTPPSATPQLRQAPRQVINQYITEQVSDERIRQIVQQYFSIQSSQPTPLENASVTPVVLERINRQFERDAERVSERFQEFSTILESNTILANPSLSGAILTGNIQTNNFWLSNNGDDEGIYISATGNVGIGTSTPDSRLTVAGDVRVSGLLSVAGATSFGTTSVASLSLTQPLDMASGGTGAIDPLTARTNLGLGSLATLSSITNTQLASGVFSNITGTGLLTTGGIGVGFGDINIGPAHLTATGAITTGLPPNRLVVTTSTSSLTSSITAADLRASVIETSGTGDLVFSHNPVFSGSLQSAIIQGNTSASGTLNLRATTNSSPTPGVAAISLGYGAGGASEAMRVDAASGRVSIGTTLPLATMTLNSGASSTAVLITNNDSTSRIVFANSTVSNFAAIGLNTNGLALSGGGDHILNPHLYINDGGDIGIGTTTPSSRLTVAGSLRATGTVRFDTLTTGLVQASADGTLSSIATSSLGLGNGTFLGLTDTPSSFTSNRILFTSNDVSPAITDDANFTFNGTNLVLGGTTGISLGGDVLLNRGAANRLDLASGDSLRIVSGSLQLGSDVALSRGAANRLDLATGDSLNLVSGSLMLFGTNYLTGNNTTKNVTLGELAGASFATSGLGRNVAIGFEAGRNASTTGATFNNYIGDQAGRNSTGTSNNIFGDNAGVNNTGSLNNLFGPVAGFNNTGSDNNLLGSNAGYANTGSNNNLFGRFAGYANTGSNNNLFGASAGANNTGSFSEFIGFEAAARMSASNTIAIGRASLRGGVDLFDGNAATTTNNTALGAFAGFNVQTGGDNNLLLGYRAGYNLTTGANNIAIGYDIDLPSNTASNQLNIGNLIFGTGIDGTGTTLSTGNLGIGTSTPSSRLTVAGDAFITGALRDSTYNAGTAGMILQTTGTGTRWTATSSLGLAGEFSYGTDNQIPFVTAAGNNFEYSSDLTFTGTALSVGGNINVASVANAYQIQGVPVLRTNFTASNLMLGQNAGRDITTATNNVAIGPSALLVATSSASFSVAVGPEAMSSLRTGNSNIALGYRAMRLTTSGLGNIVIGVNAVTSSTNIGDRSVVIGQEAARNLTGSNSVILGYRAADEGGSIQLSTIIGSEAAQFITTGQSNVVVGARALRYNTTGERNTVLGSQALGNGTTFAVSRNTAVGFGAGTGLTTGGNDNILIGYQAGDSLTTGSGNVVIGYNIDLPIATSTNRLSIGNLIYGTGLNGSGTSLSTGNVGIGTSTPESRLSVVGSISSTDLVGSVTTLSTDVNGNIIRTPSDQNLKTNVSDLTGSLATVLALRGVRYNWLDTARFGTQPEIGFLAQEVDIVLPELVKKDGEYWSLNTPNMLAVVIEAIKEIWQTVLSIQTDIAGLRAQNEALELENERINHRLNELEQSLGNPVDQNNQTSPLPTTENNVPDESSTDPSLLSTEPTNSEPASSEDELVGNVPSTADEVDLIESDMSSTMEEIGDSASEGSSL